MSDLPTHPDPISEKDKVQLLVTEYGTLRTEILNRTGYGFQTMGVGAALLVFILQQGFGWASIIGAIALIIGASVVGWFNVRDITAAHDRIVEIETEINNRAGEYLLVWEALWSAGTKGYFSMTTKPLPRTRLPPINEEDPQAFLRE